MNKLNCPSCKKGVEIKFEEKTFPSGIKHIGAYCSACGRWIKWISKEEFKWEQAIDILKKKYQKNPRFKNVSNRRNKK